MCDEAEPRSESMCGGAIINKVSTSTTHIKRPSGMNDENIHFPRKFKCTDMFCLICWVDKFWWKHWAKEFISLLLNRSCKNDVLA